MGGWGGGWALVGLGLLGEFKKRNSIGWQLESPGLPFLPRAASATGSALLPTHPQLHRLAAAHASKRGLFAAPSGEHSATRTGSPRWPRNKKKEQQQLKKHINTPSQTHTHWQRNTRVACTGTALNTYRRRTREGGGGGRYPCRGVQPAVGVAGVGHGCGGRCCLVANQVCSHRFLARIPAMPIWMHVHNTDMNTHTHHHTGLAETDPGAPCFAATTGCTPCWQQAKKSVWGGRYFVGTKVPTGAEQQNGNEILHFENNRILPTVCCLSKV